MDQIQTPVTDEQRVLLTWQAPIIPKHTRTKRWYMIAGAIVIACAAYGILTGAWSFAIVALLCGAMYYLMHDHVPPEKTIVITDKGVLVAERYMRWEDLKGFWFLRTPEYTELHFVPKLARRTDLLIQTGTQSLEQLRMLIGVHTPELTEKQESFLDALVRTAKL